MSTLVASDQNVEGSDSLETNEPEKRQPAAKYDLATLLRNLGGGAVVCSLAAFLFKGWAGTDDLFKYALLLASTTSIAGIALLIAHYLREGKGPRLLLSLSLVAVPINFSILGAFILYATSSTGGASYPDYLAWTIGSQTQAFTTALIGVLLLLPVMWLGFRTLSRGLSTKLTASFIVSNLLLLLPIRDPIFVTSMAVVLGIVALLISRSEVRQRIESQTSEGRLALLIQFIPLGILVGRNLWLYASDQIVMLAGMGLFFLLLRQVSMVLAKKSTLRAAVNLASVLPIFVIFPLAHDVLGMGMSESNSLLFTVFVTAGLCYEISCRNMENRVLYRGGAMLLAVIGCGFVVFGFDAVLSSAFVFLAGVGLSVAGFRLQQRALSMTGMLLLALAGLNVFVQMFTLFDLGSWVTLMLAGITAIVAASVLDTHGQRLRGQVVKQHRQFSEWTF